ncbi:MarR family winged helix-turn-helix transcriptional regulator [Amorphus sp. 3PC139-8]|uniref:MarR family winged helix-turn-helix transcriptional regulator n=1 Tax=Amorphus sp. 3PC139-8 TaxID=2735676 RepID=UPI00345CDDFC
MTSQDTRNPAQSLSFLIHDVARLMRRDISRRIQGLGMTPAQWRALAYVAKQEGLRQAALADLMEIQPITLARLIDRLEEANLVERRPDPTDRRAVQLYLAAGAEAPLETMWERASETRALALDGVSPEAVDQMIEALDRMRRNLIAGESPVATDLRASSEDETETQ